MSISSFFNKFKRVAVQERHQEPKKRKKHITHKRAADRKDLAKGMWNRGLEAEEIARELNVAASTVYAYLGGIRYVNRGSQKTS